MILRCSNCPWKEGRHGGHDLDRGRIDVVDDAKGLLLVCVPLLCCLPVKISVAIAIVRSQSSCSCCSCCNVPVALGGKDGMVTKILIENVSTLLLMIQDCRVKQNNKHALNCNYHN